MGLLLRLIVLLSIAAGACLPAWALDLQRRRMMTAAEQKPWRGVGRLDVKNQFSEGMCTGTLIAEDLVLTAAHCVTSELTGLIIPPDGVEFIAGERLGVSAGKSKAARIAVHPSYDAGRSGVGLSIRYDMALVRLEKPIPKARAPYFAIAPTPDLDAALTLISYRRDRTSGLTRQDGCTITTVVDAVMTLGCDVTFGASGSSFFQIIDGEPHVVAVLSAMEGGAAKPVAYAVTVESAMAEVLAELD
ncbi:MAG TPA: trypsin-like serine protease [Thermohalobaculum sp.]|nr:trypsin-like serine protease [Thermohalobaculum sp.]